MPGSNDIKGKEAMEKLGTKLWVRLGASPEKRTADNLTISQVLKNDLPISFQLSVIRTQNLFFAALIQYSILQVF